jgi:hypothetical protein
VLWTAYQYLFILVCYAIIDAAFDWASVIYAARVIVFIFVAASLIPPTLAVANVKNISFLKSKSVTFSTRIFTCILITGALAVAISYDLFFLKTLSLVGHVATEFNFKMIVESKPFDGIGAHCAGSKEQDKSYLTCQLLVINNSRDSYVLYGLSKKAAAYLESTQNMVLFGEKKVVRVSAAIPPYSQMVSPAPPILVEAGKTLVITMKFEANKMVCETFGSALKGKDSKLLLTVDALFNAPDILSGDGVASFYRRKDYELPGARGIGKWSVPLELIDDVPSC